MDPNNVEQTFVTNELKCDISVCTVVSLIRGIGYPRIFDNSDYTEYHSKNHTVYEMKLITQLINCTCVPSLNFLAQTAHDEKLPNPSL